MSLHAYMQYHLDYQFNKQDNLKWNSSFAVATQLSCDKHLMESTNLTALMQEATVFSWKHLDTSSFTEATQWYRANCDPMSVLSDTKDKAGSALRYKNIVNLNSVFCILYS